MKDQSTKRCYNATFRLRKKGFKVSGRKKAILIYFDEITQLVTTPEVRILLTEFNFTVKQNRQYKLPL